MPGGTAQLPRGLRCSSALQRADARRPLPAAPRCRRLGTRDTQDTPRCVPTSTFPLRPAKTGSRTKVFLPPSGPQKHALVSNPRAQLMAISIPPICSSGSSASCYRSHQAAMGPATFCCHRDANDVPLCHPPSPLPAGEEQLEGQRENSQLDHSWKESLPLLQGFNLHFPGMD